MSLFDQPYYVLTKAHMSRMGIWPEQSKYVRILVPSMLFCIVLTIVGPMTVRLLDVWRDIDILVHNITIYLILLGTVSIPLTCIQHIDSMKLSLEKIEDHWEMCKNTSAVIVLDMYAERGRFVTVIYSTFIYITSILFYGLSLSPKILDYIYPVNESRPKKSIIDPDYGVDADKYYWLITGHTYIVTAIVICMILATGTMYILWTVHACALFEVVGFNLKMTANEYTVNKENDINLRSDWDYKKICDCIILHTEAISFADLIESISSGCVGVLIGTLAVIAVISGVQALVNWKHPERLIQHILLLFDQILHLYIICTPGQELINHSGKIHTTAYNLHWQDMSAIAQKLLIPILMRSNKPCYFTAGKVYVLSMETFGSAIRTMVSYFTIFVQMI